jgi:hypothetical protein
MAPVTLSVKAFNDAKFDVEVDGTCALPAPVLWVGQALTVCTRPWPDDGTVLDLKAAVEAANGTPADQQRLIFSGRVLKDSDKLAVYGVKVVRRQSRSGSARLACLTRSALSALRPATRSTWSRVRQGPRRAQPRCAQHGRCLLRRWADLGRMLHSLLRPPPLPVLAPPRPLPQRPLRRRPRRLLAHPTPLRRSVAVA